MIVKILCKMTIHNYGKWSDWVPLAKEARMKTRKCKWCNWSHAVLENCVVDPLRLKEELEKIPGAVVTIEEMED